MNEIRVSAAHDSSYLQRLFTLGAMVAAILAAYLAKAVLLPIALAVLLSFVVAPLVELLERLRIGRVGAVAIVLLFVTVLVTLLGWIFVDQMVQLGSDLPQYQDNLIAKIRALRGAAQGKFRSASNTVEAISKELADRPGPENSPQQPSWLSLFSKEQWPLAKDSDGKPAPVPVRVVEMPGAPLALAVSWLGPLAAPLGIGAMVFVLMMFFLVMQEDQRDRVIRLFGPTNVYVTTRAIAEATARVSKYLRAALVVNACFGIVTTVGLWLIGLPNALLWGVLSFVLRFLPYVGAWISAGMPILLSLVVFDGWLRPLAVVALFVVAEVSISNFLEPFVYGNSMGISPIGVLLAALFWTWLWGPVGLVIAMPITVCLVVAAQYIPELRFLHILLGDRPTLSPEERMYQRLLAIDSQEASELAAAHLKTGTLGGLYDDVMIPVLGMVERDRYAGLLSQDQGAFVLESARDLNEESAERARDAGNANPVNGKEPRVLCIPVRDKADEIAAQMLAHLLADHGIGVHTASSVSLTSEWVERVGQEEYDLVVLSAMAPLATRKADYLCKRVRQRYHDLSIIVGLWTGEATAARERFRADASTEIVTTLADAVKAVRNAVARLSAAANHESPKERNPEKAGAA